ncbi:hypothetical protein VS868_11840 [Salinimicrobium sp. 3283s]|uniref:hypothetical protein n=1 Tax=Salinimicrobium sp. 3283s TaxID=3114359 RepID=UPI0031EBC3AE
MKVNVSFRIAVPEDLKVDSRTLKVGQTYAVTTDEGKTILGIFALRGDEDPFILKYYLENQWLLVPENDPNFSEWIQENEEQLCNDSDYITSKITARET